MKLKYVHKVSMWFWFSDRQGVEESGFGGNVATAAGDSGKAVQFVEIRNFARHHQRETFPTSWVVGWLRLRLHGWGTAEQRHDGEMRAGAWRINTHTKVAQTSLSLSRTLLMLLLLLLLVVVVVSYATTATAMEP